MKGLLLKDLYMLRAYCKSFVLILVVFLVASFFGGKYVFHLLSVPAVRDASDQSACLR